jgi:YD repeat-containing protein
LGRVTSYTDADGNVSATSYDIDGRPVGVTDGKGVTTHTYDSATEHRGLVTAMDAGITGSPSTSTATYDAAGRLSSQTMPTGLVQAMHYDDGDNPTQLTNSKSGTTWLTFTETHSATGLSGTASRPAVMTTCLDGSCPAKDHPALPRGW